MPQLDTDRLLPLDDRSRGIARDLYTSISNLPIISPHGHTEPAWFANNTPFANAAELFVVPDHYVFRMLVSQGIELDSLGVPRADGTTVEQDPRAIWALFAKNYHLFRGTPSQLWLDHSFEHVFGIREELSAETADDYYTHITNSLATPDFLPRALFDRFNIEALATTESALDELKWHKQLGDSDWQGRIITTYRPDAVVDPEFADFANNVAQLGSLTGCDTQTFSGYLQAHRLRRQFFKTMGATATDHGHASARTEDFPPEQASKLFEKALAGQCSAEEADAFRGHMLTEMARMSLDDGLIMQIHPGSARSHNHGVAATHGRDKGFDIPTRTEYVHALQPLLNAVGMEKSLTIIVFTLDETAFSRELAPLAGVYPALKLGPPWWFFDSYEGMRRFRETTTETCGFYNTAGFNDDTRAFCSIPARHDVARRVDCAYLATLVTTGRLREKDAIELAFELTYGLVKKAYRL
ncbi:glucuronate isomerase [Granulosicoccus antarcticus]|uniref:Uronate isomerase n=1 Tax=Granulosicoccus antarcticus IMCC3135 TaxID=1192854 RepID=A0A2Z2NH34_9GAMM|nr:glucuronate isomerase [Granulosicoccus antarcticus]ASJ70439.1 Uronate isomerase [Granulosicoccus antarcticus IMCC3135]